MFMRFADTIAMIGKKKIQELNKMLFCEIDQNIDECFQWFDQLDESFVSFEM